MGPRAWHDAAMKPRRSTSRVRLLTTSLALVSGLCLTALVGVPASSAGPRLVTPAPAAPAVTTAPASSAAATGIIGRWSFGRTVRGREMVGYHMGNPNAAFTAVVVSGMHGNEAGTTPLAQGVIDLASRGRFSEVNLWVIQGYNPDGLIARDRQNARGVDLNRNFDNNWRPLTGNYYSGPRANSEPETQAMIKFLTRVAPDVVLSFHQPLNGVDVDTKFPSFARKTAELLALPEKRFTCGGVCYGTMTGWFNSRFPGVALTVEYGRNPDPTYMRVHAAARVAALLQRSAGSA